MSNAESPGPGATRVSTGQEAGLFAQVSEIFLSLQGESAWAGWPCAFVRLTGCNLRCAWCDTTYSFHGGRRMSLDAIRAQVAGYETRRVEITGGEPLLQAPAVAALAAAWLDEGYTVLLETSGERDLAPVPAGVVKIVDVKCPASGEAGRFHAENLARLGPRDELKFVLAGREDYEFARDFLARHGLPAAPGPRIALSPAFSPDAAGERGARHCRLDPAALAAWMLADGLDARLALQIHKFIWDPARHGV